MINISHAKYACAALGSGGPSGYILSARCKFRIPALKKAKYKVTNIFINGL
jgi:hypothetical protein